VFTLRPEGLGILLIGSVGEILWTSLTAAVGVAALAISAGGWLRRKATVVERLLAAVAGLLLMYPAAATDVAGLGCFAAMMALHFARPAAGAPPTSPAASPQRA
jgi:TRAP-type uncharacterized transport system fused permease subunit